MLNNFRIEQRRYWLFSCCFLNWTVALHEYGVKSHQLDGRHRLGQQVLEEALPDVDGAGGLLRLDRRQDLEQGRKGEG